MASSFARMLQEAVDQGQVVLVSAPGRSPNPTIPPLRERNEVSLAALCLIFKVKRSEAQMLVKLLSQDCSTTEELRAAASHAGKTITSGTTHIFLSGLRKRLAPFDIQISTIPTLGYGLDGKARDKIHELLTEHDRAIRPLAK